MNPLYKRMHFPYDNQEPEHFGSVHLRGIKKTYPYKKVDKTMRLINTTQDSEGITKNLDAEGLEPEDFIFQSEIYPYHALHRCCLITTLPEISAKEGYQIRWKDNLLIEAIHKYGVKYNEMELECGTNKSLLFYVQTSKNRSNIERNLNYSSSNNEWYDKLTSQTISMFIPYFDTFFPLRYLGKGDTLEFYFKADFRIKSLVEIRKKDDGETVPFDFNHIEVKGGMKYIEIPSLEGTYTTMGDDEFDLTDTENKDVEIFLTYNKLLSSESDVVIKSSDPILRFEWTSKSPIKSSVLKNKDETIFEGNSYKTSKIIPERECENIPYLKNMHFYKPDILRVCEPKKFSQSLVIDDGVLSVVYENDSSDKSTQLNLVCIKRIIIKEYPKTQEERRKKGSLIFY